MSPRDALHQLVDTLPDRELNTAVRVLEALTATTDAVALSLDRAELDDEVDDDDFDGGLAQARAEAGSIGPTEILHVP
jgi:hypothetical protein